MGVSARPLGMLLLLALLAGILFHPAVDAPFHFDDHHSIRLNPYLDDPAGIPEFFTDATRFSADADRAMFRPLVLTSYALTRAIAGPERLPAWLHLENIVLHILVAWLVWGLVRQEEEEGSGHVWSAMAAVGFLLYPVAAETALYISARSESLSAVLSLLTILLWRRERRLPALICYALALSCKSTALVAPVILWALERLEAPTARRSSTSAMLPLAGVALAYVLVIQGLIESSLIQQQVRTPVQQVLVQLHAWIYQLRLVIVPHPLSVVHPVDTAAIGWSHLGAGVMLISLASWVIRSPTRIWASVAVLSPLLIPSIIPLHTVVSEHRLYLALAAAFIVAGRLARMTRWRRPVVQATAVALGLWAFITVAQVARWTSEEQIWRNAATVAPGSARVHEFLGDVLRRQERPEEALVALQRADRLYGGRLATQLSISGILLQQNQLDGAVKVLEPLRQQYPEHPDVLYNLALARRSTAPDEALTLLERVLVRRPTWPAAIMERSLLLEEVGRRKEAAAGLREALRDQAHWLEGWINLGFIEARQGNFSAARSAWNRAAQIDPAQLLVQQNLAELDRIEASAAGARP